MQGFFVTMALQLASYCATLVYRRRKAEPLDGDKHSYSLFHFAPHTDQVCVAFALYLKVR